MKSIQKSLYLNSGVYLFLRDFTKSFIYRIKLAHFRCKWRLNNKHNYTEAQNIYPIELVSVGRGTYGPLKVYSFSHPDEKLCIGNYCSIAGDVTFILGGNHPTDTLSTYPFSRHFHEPPFYVEDRSSKGPIIVGSDVWIGHGAIILSGATIGQGAVIGAGSVVAKDVPPYAVYVGNHVVKYRFAPEVIQKLLNINYDTITDLQLLNIEPLLYVKMNEKTASDICNSLSI